MDYDEDRITYTNQNLLVPGQEDGGDGMSLRKTKAEFREFIRSYRQGNLFPYRDQLLQRYRKREPFLEVNIGHVNEFKPELFDLLTLRPVEFLPLFEEAAREVLKQLTADRTDGEDLPEIQVVIRSEQLPTGLRGIAADHVNKLLKVPGIIISATRIRAKAVSVAIRCKTCGCLKHLPCNGPFGGAALPMKCDRNGQEGEDCGKDSFLVVPDESMYVDQQTLKLQASIPAFQLPEVVPTGEMPRNILAVMDRTLVDRVSPGTRVSVMGIASLYNSASTKKQVGAVAIRTPYIKVVGVEVDSDGAGRSSTSFTPAEEEEFLAMARTPDIYSRMAASMAPSISGEYTKDIKKALACLLFGGSRKVLPDGTRLRGDVNVLLLGDPSTAKSQFLKFAEKVAPVGVYTSGKGSSAAGLTASVIRDSRGEFYLEGGAMVLADGGIVCIDEFDKMRESDRVAIHEAMEQQTISVAKAGITTILNRQVVCTAYSRVGLRTSVLAAANPIYGRYDDLKSAAENIDLMTTILSRFDLIFIVRDIRQGDEERDRSIARHVMSVHINASAVNSSGQEGEIDIATMKKYVSYCRLKCAPRLSVEAASMLSSQYVSIREEVRRRTLELGEEAQAVPITVRQLEALVRLSESLPKMRLSGEVSPQDVQEALRLFNVSTMAAAKAGSSAGDLGSLRPEGQKEVQRAEDFLKRRIAVRSTVNRKKVAEEATGQGHPDSAVQRAIAIMCIQGVLQEKNRGFLLFRLR
ncbi:unnamed protein product [Discosporangium mesarthrocarpum]